MKTPMGMIINYSAAIGLFDWLTFKYVSHVLLQIQKFNKSHTNDVHIECKKGRY